MSFVTFVTSFAFRADEYDVGQIEDCLRTHDCLNRHIEVVRREGRVDKIRTVGTEV